LKPDALHYHLVFFSTFEELKLPISWLMESAGVTRLWRGATGSCPASVHQKPKQYILPDIVLDVGFNIDVLFEIVFKRLRHRRFDVDVEETNVEIGPDIHILLS
jgi:hypothetical protein